MASAALLGWWKKQSGSGELIPKQESVSLTFGLRFVPAKPSHKPKLM